MPNNTYLTADDTTLADLGTARYACLCCYHGVFTYLYVVGYLYQVVQLYTAAYVGRAHGCPVNSSIRAYFHIVFYYHIAYLRYFLVAAVFLRGKAEAIARAESLLGTDEFGIYGCEALVAHAFGVSQAEYGWDGAAETMYQTLLGQGKIHKDMNPPRGALVFSRGFVGAHIDIARGDGTYVSGGVQGLSPGYGDGSNIQILPTPSRIRANEGHVPPVRCPPHGRADTLNDQLRRAAEKRDAPEPAAINTPPPQATQPASAQGEPPPAPVGQ